MRDDLETKMCGRAEVVFVREDTPRWRQACRYTCVHAAFIGLRAEEPVVHGHDVPYLADFERAEMTVTFELYVSEKAVELTHCRIRFHVEIQPERSARRSHIMHEITMAD